MKPQKEKPHLEGLTRIIDTVAKVRKIIQIDLMKIKYISSCCHFSMMWSSTPRKVHVYLSTSDYHTPRVGVEPNVSHKQNIFSD